MLQCFYALLNSRLKMTVDIPSKENVKKTVGYKIGTVSGYMFIGIISIFFWVYLPIKLFVYDIDNYLINKYFPAFTWLLNFKFFIFIGAIALLWIFLGTKNLFVNVLIGFFYPLFIVCWKIPVLIFRSKSWNLAFAFANLIFSFFQSFKINFLLSAGFLISIAIVVFNANPKLIWISIVLLLLIVLSIYTLSFISVFKPTQIFKIYMKIFSWVREKPKSIYAMDNSIKKLPVSSLDQTQLQKRITNLQTSVLFNRICLYSAKKLRNYQSSGINIISNTCKILFLVFFTVFSFTFINFGLFKIDEKYFGFSASPHLFTFFYYSFTNLFYASIQQMTPALPISQIFSMFEFFLSLFLIVIFVSLQISIRSQRTSDELNKAIKVIENEGGIMESFIRDEYGLGTIDDAIEELQKAKAGLLNFVFILSAGIREDE